MKAPAALSLLLASLTALACSEAPEPGPASSGLMAPELVVARDRLGPIQYGELDRFILTLPETHRWPGDRSARDWLTEVARRVSFARLMHAQAVGAGLEQDPEVQRLFRNVARTAYSEAFLARLPETPISEDMLRRRYEQQRDVLNRPERRRVLNIFKRISDTVSKEQARSQVEALRQRVLDGESFEHLARQVSDSETRHDGGTLGFVSPGMFPPDFDAVVFALEPGVPSDVVMTADGAHLFLVSNVLEGRTVSFRDAETMLRRELQAEAALRRLKDAAAHLESPAHPVLDRGRVAEILSVGDPTEAVLEVGDFKVTVGELRRQIEARSRILGPSKRPELPFLLLDELRCRELIYQHASADPEFPAPIDEIEAASRGQLVDFFVNKTLEQRLESEEERLRAYYEEHKPRFASPLGIRIERLTVPLDDRAAEVMAELEEARLALDNGDLELAVFGDIFGGTLQTLGPLNTRQLQHRDPRGLRFAFALQPGEHSPPYRLDKAIVMFKVLERFEPTPVPFEKARRRVIADMLEKHRPRLFGELMESTLEAAGFRIMDDAMESLAPAAPSEPAS